MRYNSYSLLSSNLTLYSLLTKLSSFIVKESISLFIVSKGMLEILFLSPEVVIIEINSENANLKPLSITSSLLKLSSNGSSISIFDILNVLAFKVEKKNTFINRTIEKKNYI